MYLRRVFAVLAACFCFALSAVAQTDPGTPSGAPPASDSTPSKSTTKKSKKKSSRKKGSSKSKKLSKKSRRKKKSDPATAAQPVSSEPVAVTDDGEAPQLTHQAGVSGTRGKPLTIAVHAADPNGVYGPVLYVRKKGMSASDYVPIRMVASKIVPGDYSVDVPAALTRDVDGIDYYVEAWDMAGNGPSRVGTAEQPLSARVDEEQKPIAPTAPTNVTIRPKGVPPAITHAAVTEALRGKPVEINARLAGETGVQGAAVMFRRSGEKDYRALPMGNIGGDDYTATIPASMTTTDVEYYVEAYDQYGNGPARSGSPNVPYSMHVADGAPAAVAAAPVPPPSAHRRVIEDEDSDRTIIGIGIDGGAPGGGGLTLLVRPLWWLRLNGGLAYNVAGYGFRGGITLSPGQWAVTPTLNLDAGRYLSGDFTKFVTVTDPNEASTLSHTRYTFATAQLGLEFGSQRRFSFYIRGGVTYLLSSISASDAQAVLSGNTSGVNWSAGKTTVSALLPCASLGFNLFVY
jgi:hypothetical protein